MKKKRFLDSKIKLPVSGETVISDCVSFIEEALRSVGTDKKVIIKTLLIAEETAAQFVSRAPKDEYVYIRVTKYLSDAQITISVKGDEYDPYLNYSGQPENIGDMDDNDVQPAIRSIILKSFGEKLKFSYKNKTNRARITAAQAELSMLHETVIALIIGVIFGVLIKYALPPSFGEIPEKYFLTPIKTVFMNALKIIIAPVVFFSIVSCISQFKNLAELGRIGLKVMGMYLLTTVIAVLMSMGVSLALHPGEFGFALTAAEELQEVSVDTNTDTSLLNTIINIVPSNFVRPFLESDTLQLIFLAVMCGAAVGMIGEYSAVLQEFFEACNSLFLTLTSMITRFIPLAVFCSIALTIIQSGGSSLINVLSVTAVQLLSIAIMMLIYGLLILIIGHLNPIKFFIKIREGMLTSLMLSSSSAAMPTNMRICNEKLGVSQKISSFSIPLGATVNMDGACIFLVTVGTFLARAYGVEIPASSYVSLGITVILLSLGAPGVPGSALVCLGIILNSMGIPLEAIGLIIGVAPFLDMFDTMSNTTGDMAAALIVASKEGLLDVEKYNSKVSG